MEVPDRRHDPSLPVLVHSMEDIEVPGPPVPFLDRLAWSCLGVASVDEAAGKLSNFPETLSCGSSTPGDDKCLALAGW